jgi:hypothetical protein
VTVIKRIVQIFKKDAAHLWPQILAFVATLILFAYEDPAYVRYRAGLTDFVRLLYLLLPLSCWLLVTSVIQQERPVGHEQYWLTRPFSRTDLLAAKTLFLLAFVIMPVFTCHAVVLDVNGFSPVEHFGDLLVKQIFFTSLLLLPMAAIATVTRNLGQAFLGGFLPSLVLAVAGSKVTDLFPDATWAGLEWIRETAVAAITLCGTAVVIYFQYARRRPGSGIVVLCGVMALVLVAWTTPPWQPAFAIQSWFSKQRINPQAVRISFDPRRDVAAPGLYVRGAGVCIRIPIRVDDVPAGLKVVADWLSVESPWRSGWTGNWAIRWNAPGQAYLAAGVDGGAFERYKNASIHLRGSFDLTLTAPGAERSGVGRCGYEGWDDTYCLSPLPALEAGELGTVKGYAPYPTSPWFGPIQKYSMPLWRLREAGMDSVVAHIQRSFDLGPLRLADVVAP